MELARGIVKPAPFAYVRAQALVHVHELLERYGPDAKLLAGGQSLLAALNMRLASPGVVIDINGLDDHAGIGIHDESIRVGALVRHAQLERSRPVADAVPLLAEAIAHVAHPAIRNRGTFGGSLALADPAAELPACCLALDATLIVASAAGERRIRAADFFLDLFETALGPRDVLLGAEFTRLRPDEHCAFVEIARRHGDYAAAGIAVKARIVDGVASELRLAFFAIGRTPTLAEATASSLVGRVPDRNALAAAKAALRQDLEPMPDLYHGVQTKLHLAGVVLERALAALPLRHP
jgi:carbon-monoxide dehydrogenase medium subunit